MNDLYEGILLEFATRAEFRTMPEELPAIAGTFIDLEPSKGAAWLAARGERVSEAVDKILQASAEFRQADTERKRDYRKTATGKAVVLKASRSYYERNKARICEKKRAKRKAACST